MKTQIEEETVNRVTFYNNNLQVEIDYVKSVLYQFLNNDSIAKVSYENHSLSNSEYYELLNSVQDQISIMEESSQLISDIFVLIEYNNKVLVKNNYYDVDNAFYNQFAQNNSTAKYNFLETDDLIYYYASFPVNVLYTNQEPLFIIVITVSKDQIQDYLSNTGSNINDNLTLVLHDTGNLIQANPNSIDISNVNEILLKLDLSNNTETPLLQTIMYNKDEYFCVTEYFSLLNASLVQIVPISNIFYPLLRFRLYTGIFILVCIFAAIFFVLTSYKLVKQPSNNLIKAFAEIENGKFDASVENVKSMNEFDYLIKGFNRMSKKLTETINTLYKREILLNQMELKQLQMQINPHFLYNSYFILHRLIEQEETENASVLSKYLGEYFQYITRSDTDRITLFQEWQHANSYINIQAIRFKRSMKIDIAPVPEGFNDFIVPRLILQPIFENAIEHGLSQKTTKGLIKLTFDYKKDYLYIVIEDNGDNLNDSELQKLKIAIGNKKSMFKNTTALINIHRRLELEYGEDSGIDLKRAEIGGLSVILKINLAHK